jgi:hypothetical protein
MASKMPTALDENGTHITTRMAERWECRRPLKCEFCDASVVFVNAYTYMLWAMTSDSLGHTLG